jgi:hypothetical protein
MDASDPQLAKVSSLRRSQRVYISIEIVVLLHKPGEKPRSEETKTLIVNAHGALILLHAQVVIGESLILRNVKTEEELSCRVVDFQTSSQPDMKEVGIEFIQPAPRFWGVGFPPADWSPRSPEAKGYRPKIVAPPSTTKKS